MPSNILYMALDSIIEGEPVDVVVNRVLLVEGLSQQRRAVWESRSNSGYSGSGGKTSHSALAQKKIHENKGGTGPINHNDETSISSDVACNPDGKKVGKGVIRSKPATFTSYPYDCELIYPPITTKTETYNPEGISTLVEYNLPSKYFVVIRLINVPSKLLQAMEGTKSLRQALVSIFNHVKKGAPSAKLEDVDDHYPSDITIVCAVANQAEAKSGKNSVEKHLRSLNWDRPAKSKIEIKGVAYQESPQQDDPMEIWDETTII